MPSARSRRLPQRRHPGRDEARPVGEVFARRAGHLGRATRRDVRLGLGGSIHHPTDPVGRLLFSVLAMVAEFEADLISMRTREGMKVAKAKGRLRGKQPKLSKMQSRHLVELDAGGAYTTAELAELFSVSRATVYRTIHRDPPPPNDRQRPFARSPMHQALSAHADL